MAEFNPPEDQTFKVVVSTSGDFEWVWEGYADNTTEAHYKSLEAWDEHYRQQTEG